MTRVEMPQTDFDNWEKASQGQLIEEIKTLRRHVALLTTMVSDVLQENKEMREAAYSNVVTVEWAVFKASVERRFKDIWEKLQPDVKQ